MLCEKKKPPRDSQDPQENRSDDFPWSCPDEGKKKIRKEEPALLTPQTLVLDEASLRGLFAEFLRSSIMYLVQEGYRGFNIVRHRGRYYALPQTLGPLDLPKVEESTLRNYEEHHLCVIGNSPDEVKDKIDRTNYRPYPELVEEGYRGFNLLLFEDKFFAIAQSLGNINLTQIDTEILRQYQLKNQCFVGRSLEEVKRLIDESGYRGAPVLVEEGYKGFNIVAYQEKIYALSVALGHVDLTQVESRLLQALQEKGLCFVGKSEEEVKCSIDHFGVKSRLPSRNPRGRGASLAKPIEPSPQELSGKRSYPEDYPHGEEKKPHMAAASSSLKEKALLIGNLSPEEAGSFLEKLGDYEITLLPLDELANQWPSYPRLNLPPSLDTPAGAFENLHFDLVILPYKHRLFWKDRSLLAFATSLASKVMIPFSNGKIRFYEGETLHRLQYKTSYLKNVSKLVPDLKGRRILEVGCSDGLVCDLLVSEEPEEVIGIDLLPTVGRDFPDPKITYRQMDASCLRFEDHSFDFCFSIATLEHCSEPYKVLQEMKRVTKKGGICYVQAGPLYYSPFGHHMFGYFDDFPWIHLRLSKEEIILYAQSRGIDQKVKKARGMDLQSYLDAMLNDHHINGKLLKDYHLDHFLDKTGVQVISFSKSYEGRNLLNRSVLMELNHIPPEDLVTHGFELIFEVY